MGVHLTDMTSSLHTTMYDQSLYEKGEFLHVNPVHDIGSNPGKLKPFNFPKPPTLLPTLELPKGNESRNSREVR